MNDWFIWNGTRCTEYGIHVMEQPALTLPAERVTFTNVAGRSGSVAMLEGGDIYDDITLTAECFVRSLDRIDEIFAWLRGSGTVTFANRQGGFYYARIVNQIPFEKILRGNAHHSFAVNFRCKPFFYKSNADDIELTAPGAVKNQGTVPSLPKISVYGTGAVALTVGGIVISLTGLTDGIVLDSERVDALDLAESQLMNDHMTGEFPVLGCGATAISWASDTIGGGGTVQKVVIAPRWRSL